MLINIIISVMAVLVLYELMAVIYLRHRYIIVLYMLDFTLNYINEMDKDGDLEGKLYSYLKNIEIK